MKVFVRATLFLTLLLPFGAQAANSSLAPMEVGGWLPYWRAASSTQDVSAKLSSLTEVSPFAYTVQSDGSVKDMLGVGSLPWSPLIAAAKKDNVRVIPTVMWNDSNAIQATLSSTTARRALEQRIADLAIQNGFDGIDIDFENKLPQTRDYFSLFLEGLYERIGNKWVYCSIEARTPLSDRFATPPATVEYANDLNAISQYCDRVEIMAYDQGTVDLTLDTARSSPYIPISDPAWVERAVDLMDQTIPKRKILLGVPTYGYEYAVTPLSNGYQYSVQQSFDPSYALALAAKLGITPTRNGADELSFTYKPSSTSNTAAVQLDVTTSNALTNNAVGPAAALNTQAFASAQIASPFNVVWWSDAAAVQDKVSLAERLGLRGVAVFKFDGGEDPSLWNVLPPAVH